MIDEDIDDGHDLSSRCESQVIVAVVFDLVTEAFEDWCGFLGRVAGQPHRCCQAQRGFVGGIEKRFDDWEVIRLTAPGQSVQDPPLEPWIHLREDLLTESFGFVFDQEPDRSVGLARCGWGVLLGREENRDQIGDSTAHLELALDLSPFDMFGPELIESVVDLDEEDDRPDDPGAREPASFESELAGPAGGVQSQTDDRDTEPTDERHQNQYSDHLLGWHSPVNLEERFPCQGAEEIVAIGHGQRVSWEGESLEDRREVVLVDSLGQLVALGEFRAETNQCAPRLVFLDSETG